MLERKVTIQPPELIEGGTSVSTSSTDGGSERLKPKLVLVAASLVFAFMYGTGGGGILDDVFGVDIVPTVNAANAGCSTGGGC